MKTSYSCNKKMSIFTSDKNMHKNKILFIGPVTWEWYIRDVVVNVLNCDIVESEFELQSQYYIHFRNNTQEKFMKLLSPQIKG